MIVDERFEPTLRYFRLIRSIGGVPAWVFEQVAKNHRGGDGWVVPASD